MFLVAGDVFTGLKTGQIHSLFIHIYDIVQTRQFKTFPIWLVHKESIWLHASRKSERPYWIHCCVAFGFNHISYFGLTVKAAARMWATEVLHTWHGRRRSNMSECKHLLWQCLKYTNSRAFFFLRPMPGARPSKQGHTASGGRFSRRLSSNWSIWNIEILKSCLVRSKWIHTLLVTLWVTKNSCTRGTHCIVLSRRASSETIFDDSRQNQTDNVTATSVQNPSGPFSSYCR